MVISQLPLLSLFASSKPDSLRGGGDEPGSPSGLGPADGASPLPGRRTTRRARTRAKRNAVYVNSGARWASNEMRHGTRRVLLRSL
jgi:hypothetical protein